MKFNFEEDQGVHVKIKDSKNQKRNMDHDEGQNLKTIKSPK